MSLKVVSQLSDYNAAGEFRCGDNQYLVYSNITKVVSIKTICLATAQWKDSDIVQCRKSKCFVYICSKTVTPSLSTCC